MLGVVNEMDAGADDGAVGPTTGDEGKEVGDLNPQWVAATCEVLGGCSSLFTPRKYARDVVPGLRSAVRRCALSRPPPEDAVAEVNAFIDHFSA